MKKVQLSIDERLLDRADTFADDNYMSRSALFTLALTQYLNQNDAVNALRDVSLAVRKIADNGEIDEQSKQQLEDFERLCTMMFVKK